jgi:hypothetical protein
MQRTSAASSADAAAAAAFSVLTNHIETVAASHQHELTLKINCCCLQDGRECTSRNLRENHNFTGLMMDGGYSNPALNLQQELIYASNIVQLFEKHKVPHPARGPTFDHFTVDIDVNSFGVAWKVLQAGYRPRSLAVEFNRNFAWNDPGYSVPDLPDEVWASKTLFSSS